MPASKKKSARRSAVRSVPPTLLATALRAQSEGVFIADRRIGPKGLRILFVNDSFRAMTGYAGSDLVGQWHGVLHADLGR